MFAVPGAERSLPALRQELDLLPAPRERSGAPAWTLYDPVRSQFFRMGWLEFELLSRWGDITASALAEKVRRESGLEVTRDYVETFVNELRQNQLLSNEGETSWKAFASIAAQKRQNPLTWLLHHYLFFRVPLLRPDDFLGAIERRMRFVFTRGFAIVLAVALLAGIYLAGRQWDILVSRVGELATFSNLPWFFAAIALAKMFHEFGHALVAKHHGVKVPTAGIAFMVLWPMLYTDTTDAWRLTSRRARLAIDAGGVAAELILATFALLAWALLPNGPLRDTTLLIATFTWVSTLAINLSPFMRFDGYYLLADYVDMPNLQHRAFAMALWSIRRAVFGLADAPPEPVSARRRRFMVAYAIGVWIYRLFVFTAIALLVYHFFIKLIGIGLFLVEIGWFILLPVAREIGLWWRRRREMTLTRGGVAVLILSVLAIGLLAVPWRMTVEAPAVARAASYARLYPPADGRIEHIHVKPGVEVKAGDRLFSIRSPDADEKIAIVNAKIAESKRELALISTERETADRLGVLLGEISALERELLAETELRDRLNIRAPIAGEFLDTSGDIHAGRWVGPETALGIVADRRQWTVTAYVDERDIARLSVGASVQFYATSTEVPRLNGEVIGIESANIRVLNDMELAVSHGGPIETVQNSSEKLQPRAALYRVHIELVDESAPLLLTLRGTAYIAAEPHSLLVDFWNTAVAVLLRETAF